MNGIRMSEQFWEFVMLQNNSNEVAKSIANFKCVNDEIDYLDFAIKDEQINLSYLPSNRSAKITDRTWFTSTLRQEGKIGKILQKVITDEVNEAELLKFTECAKTYYQSNKYTEELVTGERIRELYHQDKAAKKGELGSSCMRYDYCDKYLDLYVENPNISMICVFKNGMVHGRALVWSNVTMDKETVPGLPKALTICDRIYAGTPEARILIENWAKANCDATLHKAKTTNFKMHKLGDVVKELRGLSVSLERANFEYYPYLDTFFILGMKTKTLSNTEAKNAERLLRHAEGGYTDHKTGTDYNPNGDGEDHGEDEDDDGPGF